MKHFNMITQVFKIIFLLCLIFLQSKSFAIDTLKAVDLLSDKQQEETIILKIKSGQGPVTQEKIASVVVFLSARCPCSNSHIEELKSLALNYSNIQFIAVHSNQNESLEEAKIYFKKQNLKFPVLEDKGALIADEFKAFKTPHAFVVNSQGQILYKGGVSSSSHFSDDVKKYLREVLEDVSHGKEPRYTDTRSLGCVILREKN